MAIAEPTSPLWAAVKGLVPDAWPQTDEEAVRTLAQSWTTAGATFGQSMSGNQRPAGFVGPVANEAAPWPDDAGFAWMTKRLQLGADLVKQQAEMDAIAAHATAFAEDVIHAKRQIVQTINANNADYEQASTMTPGVDAGAAETFAAEVARAIDTFLTEMASSIAGRQPGVAAAAEPPTVNVDPDDLDGFGMEEAADIAGVVSAAASTAALAATPFPPLALGLGAIALITGGFAAYQHSREAIADPSASKIVTAGGDLLSLVPGVGAAGKGMNAFIDGVTSTAPGWTHVATGLGAGAPAPEVATYLQAASQVVPQVPTLSDLTTPGVQSQVASDAGSAGYLAGRAVDIVGALR